MFSDDRICPISPDQIFVFKSLIIKSDYAVIFNFRNKLSSYPSVWFEWMLAVVAFTIPVLISIYCLRHEPLLDFRPYKTGTNIPDQMVIPDDAPVDQNETTLVYQKDGLVKEFSETEFPWQDTTWKWIETRITLIKRIDTDKISLHPKYPCHL